MNLKVNQILKFLGPHPTCQGDNEWKITVNHFIIGLVEHPLDESDVVLIAVFKTL